MRYFSIWALASLLVLLSVPIAAQTVCRVTPTGNGANSGANWAQAMDLRSALAAPACQELWVARGLYKPGASGDREATFEVRANTAVYGGFLGTETAREQRDFRLNRTVLSGDIDNNDIRDADGVVARAADIAGANSHHVLRMKGSLDPIAASTLLDGLIITAGDATGTTPADGGGLYCDGFFTGSVCSPTLANLVFSGNRASRGGAIFLDGYSGGVSSPAIRHSQFNGNSAGIGGALASDARSGTSDPVLESVVFRDNRADVDGGAVYLFDYCNFTMRGGAFVGNSAEFQGGAIYTGGDGGFVNLRLANITFDANQVTTLSVNSARGGAISAANTRTTTPGTANLLFENLTFTNNANVSLGKAVYTRNLSSDPAALTQTYRNVIVWGNGGGEPGIGLALEFDFAQQWTIDRAILQDACAACTNTVMMDPLLGPIGDNGGGIPTRVPQAGSPAIDTGSNAVCAGPNVNNIDARGVTRPQGPQCDLGAVEAAAGPPPDIILRNGFEA